MTADRRATATMAPNTACAACGAAFACGAAAADCWCMDMPRAPTPDMPGGCLCRACLERRIAGIAVPEVPPEG